MKIPSFGIRNAFWTFLDNAFLRWKAVLGKKAVERHLSATSPRVVFVKQDVNEDLYCCPPGSKPADIVRSTLLRPGPVALFTDLNADFLMLETEPDPECSVWKEKAIENHWAPLSWFANHQHHVPGRPYGQKYYAQNVGNVDWNNYDIVISLDVSVPKRITKNYPNVCWTYYIREVKTSSYRSSWERPLPGQDIFLSQCFGPRYFIQKAPPHVVHFPYHLHYVHCYEKLFDLPLRPDEDRTGVFIEHHTALKMSNMEKDQLSRFGPICSTASQQRPSVGKDIAPLKTVDPEIVTNLCSSRYFVKWAGRTTFGTAIVEAIAAGCLALSHPKWIAGAGFLLSPFTTASNFSEVFERITWLEQHPAFRQKELNRQRALVDYYCYSLPLQQLLKKTMHHRYYCK